MADIVTNTLQIGGNNLILQDAGARQDIATNTQDISDLKDGLSATLDGISIAKTDTASHAISRVRINWETGEDITEAVKYYSTGRLTCDFCVGLVAKQGYKFRIAFYSSGDGAYSDAYVGNNGKYITQYTVYGAPYYRICFTTTDGSSIASGTTIYDMCAITLYSSLPVDNQSNINVLCGEVKDDISLIPTQTWESGYINSSGSNASGTKYLRTNTYYASDRDGEISITLNADYKVGIAEYDANHTFKARYTWFEFGHTVKCKKGYTYRFMILNIAGDDISSLANDPAFIASIKIGYSTIHKQIADLQVKSIRILGIGNSYTWYVYKYLCKILQECGYSEVVVGQCYKGGCTLEEQYTNRTATDFYDYYRKYNNNGLTKKDTQNVSLDTALQDEKWDYIIFQQQSDDSGQYTSFVNAGFSINDFLAYVKQYQPDAKIGLVSPWTHATGYSGTKFVEYYDGSVSQQNTAINQVIPQVMAIMSQCDMLIDFNHLVNYARQNTYLGALGDEMLQPDKNHIAYGMPDYMCGCLYALCVGANIDKMSWYPTVSDDSSITTTCDNHLAWLTRQFAKAVYSGANLIA